MHIYGVLTSVKSIFDTPIYRKRLGLAIRAERERKELSQEKLAELADVHRNYVGLIERGDQNLTVGSLINIADALKVKASELLRLAGC